MVKLNIVVAKVAEAFRGPEPKSICVDAPDDVVPVCPHCHNDLPIIWRKEVPFRDFGERFQLLMCPSCRHVINIANERGM